MIPFLKRLAGEIAERFGDDPGQLCIVLPNRRAGLYLKKYLAAELKKTAWAPQTFSVEDFVTAISGLQVIDPAGLLFEFYKVYKDVKGDKAQDFDVFADWAPVLLKDFEDIDQYLVDPEKIFSYLNAARAYSVWNLNERPLTEQEKDYVEFYNSFLVYYQRLKTSLTDKKLVYQGLAYRTAAENIGTTAATFKWKKVFFAGLNALSGAEERIIDHLVRSDKAEVFWDADEYYINDPDQEAGLFIRNYIRKWPSETVKWIGNDFKTGEKNIHVFGIPGNIGQAHQAGRIVNRIRSSGDAPDQVAVVLADENLLLPVLYALPAELDAVNVTMGYPFRLTQLYNLTGLIFQLHENAERFAGQRKNSVKSFYVKDIFKILSHPYLQLFTASEDEGQAGFEKITAILKRKNRVFLSPAGILSYSTGKDNEYKDLNQALFSPWESPVQGMESLIRVLELIRDRMIAGSQTGHDSYEHDLEYLYHLSRMVKKCSTMMEIYPFVDKLKTLRKILFQILDNSRLPFTGEPLQGLQVMGVLETRAVDFENIVILSVNEGILPTGRTPNSFIPFDIKSEFGLPTYRQKDSVFAYHFYRMLQRARNIYLLYDTEGNRFKGGEKSRFITQLGYDLAHINKSAVIEEKLLGADPLRSEKEAAITIMKSPEIMARLAGKSASGFAPSALIAYIRCPLQFYFQEILRLSEAEDIEETIEARTLGTVLHQVLFKVFKPFTGRRLDPGELTDVKGRLREYLIEAFHEHYSEGDLEHGKNHLIFRVSLFLVNQFIKKEIEDIREGGTETQATQILSLESFFEDTLTCRTAGNETGVKIKGKADRIDLKGGSIRIIDYKTGSVNPRELKIRSWDDLTTDPKMSKAFQLLFYAFLFFKKQGMQGKRIMTGNITLRRISEGFIPVILPGEREIDEEAMSILEGYITTLLEKILDPTVPFTQTDEAENCTYCPYKAICTR